MKNEKHSCNEDDINCGCTPTSNLAEWLRDFNPETDGYAKEHDSIYCLKCGKWHEEGCWCLPEYGCTDEGYMTDICTKPPNAENWLHKKGERDAIEKAVENAIADIELIEFEEWCEKYLATNHLRIIFCSSGARLKPKPPTKEELEKNTKYSNTEKN